MAMAVFVDSTTILYTQDRRFPAKQERSTRWLRSLLSSQRMVLNLQVLNETYAVVSRKADFAHWRPTVRAFIQDSLVCTTPPLDAGALGEAWALEDRYRISFRDSMVLVSANRAGCAYFLSEDLNDGQLYDAVRAINPFRHTPEDVLGPAARP
jgi:predicted nucleic acid-binding protein